MKIFCIFLTFFFTVSCGPSVLQRKTREKTREIEERRGQCYLVRGTCKASCNIWEYVFNYCGVEPCCVVREYIKPMRSTSTTSTMLTHASVPTINHGFASFPQFQQKRTWALDTKIDCGDGYTTP
ncbi:beta-defensin 113 [Vicugna pacos]|uniref:Beta-defensin 113 n=1 Tax=Vicugna pacos TaxID=30538 RepID=A0ABM5BZT7_VICPA